MWCTLIHLPIQIIRALRLPYYLTRIEVGDPHISIVSHWSVSDHPITWSKNELVTGNNHGILSILHQYNYCLHWVWGPSAVCRKQFQMYCIEKLLVPCKVPTNIGKKIFLSVIALLISTMSSLKNVNICRYQLCLELASFPCKVF